MAVREQDDGGFWDLDQLVATGEVMRLPTGACELPDGQGAFVFVVVAGTLCREVSLGRRHMLELLGPDDALQPPAAETPWLGDTAKITVIEPVTLVALGEPFLEAASVDPGPLLTVLRRLEEQRHRLGIQGLISHLPRAEHRLLLMLWHLAERWGHGTRRGIRLDLRLTHELLGYLIGSSRPTATLALKALVADGCLTRLESRSWLLTAKAEDTVRRLVHPLSDPPVIGELFSVRLSASATSEESQALKAQARQLRTRRRDLSRG